MEDPRGGTNQPSGFAEPEQSRARGSKDPLAGPSVRLVSGFRSKHVTPLKCFLSSALAIRRIITARYHTYMANLRFSPMKAFYPTADELLAANQEQLAETVLRHLKTYEGGGTVHQPVGGFSRAYYIQTMDGTIRGLGALPTTPE